MTDTTQPEAIRLAERICEIKCHTEADAKAIAAAADELERLHARVTELEAQAPAVPIKRYEPEIYREDRVRMELDADGDWVRYSDHVALTAAQAQAPAVPAVTHGMYEHKCPHVTGHRGPSFVCQKAGHCVGQQDYCGDCPTAMTAPHPVITSETGKPISPQGAAITSESGAPQPDASLSSDTLYLLRRLLSNQHTFTGPEFRKELTKIVGEAYQNESAPLTDEQIESLFLGVDSEDKNRFAIVRGFARAIEQAHGITKREPQGKPSRLEAFIGYNRAKRLYDAALAAQGGV